MYAYTRSVFSNKIYKKARNVYEMVIQKLFEMHYSLEQEGPAALILDRG